MLSTASMLLGGIGVFLVGMILMTDGLKTAAGSSLQRSIGSLTRGPGQAMAAGAGITAILQSSSATTVATIGFVSAGMLPFQQAFGIIMGANLGTTSTGWIVALLGLKLKIGAIALPFVGVGALLRLLSGGRRAQIGLAVAGFGLVFLGIDVLQEGMAGLSERFDPAAFPSPRTPVGILLLTFLGAGTTVVMQSSSAAVATTLTALHAGTLDMGQAVYLVVGQNVGTTVTAALAALGASIPARRTALAHILFNLLTAAVALAALPFLLPVLLPWATGVGQGDLTLVIAGFHTGFNVLGVLIFLPFLGVFSRTVIRLVPEREPALTRHLDRSMTEVPAAGLAAARIALRRIAAGLARGLHDRLTREPGRPVPEKTLAELTAAITRVREFLGTLSTSAEGREEFDLHIHLLHAADHLDRLVDDVRKPADPSTAPEAVDAAERLSAGLEAAIGWFTEGTDDEGEDVAEVLAEISTDLARERRQQRPATLERTALGELSPEAADDQLLAMRWIDSLTYYVWRIVHHLGAVGPARGDPREDPER